MLKGLAITPPVIGRISIGRVVEKNGKRLPEKDDQFTITTQVQNRDGWLLHPYDSALRHGLNSDKLRMIPIRMPFNDPALNLRSEYCLFDRENGRPVCVGNGETCRRYAGGEMQSLPCPSPDTCQFANGQCKPYGRLNIKVGDDDDFGTFIFRTSGYNSIRCLTARLHYYQAASGGLLAYMPLQLQLRGKSTTQSHRRPIYFVDITARDGLSLMDALSQAKETHQQRTAAGFNQEALDEAARTGFANGAFEDTTEDLSAITEEFFVSPESGEDLPELSSADSGGTGEVESSSLRDKLAKKIKP